MAVCQHTFAIRPEGVERQRSPRLVGPKFDGLTFRTGRHIPNYASMVAYTEKEEFNQAVAKA
jgi:hypothetical protein